MKHFKNSSVPVPTLEKVYNKPLICDKTEPIRRRVKVVRGTVPTLMPFRPVETIVKPVTYLCRMRHERFYYPSCPFDKLAVEVERPLPEYNWELITDTKASYAFVKSITRTFSKNMSKSFVVGCKAKPIFIFSNMYKTRVQFNPKFHSSDFMKLFVAMTMGVDTPAQIAMLHVSVDVKIKFHILKERLRVGHKHIVETYSPKDYITKYSPKEGRQVKLPLSTEYLGKNNRVVIYDSGKKHGIAPDSSRVEIQLNQRKRINYLTLDRLEDLSQLEPFKNIHLPLELKVLTGANKLYLEYFEAFQIEHRLTFKEAIAIIRKDDKSKADSISRALRLREKFLFDFQASYQKNFSIYYQSRLSPDEIALLTKLTEVMRSRGKGST